MRALVVLALFLVGPGCRSQAPTGERGGNAASPLAPRAAVADTPALARQAGPALRAEGYEDGEPSADGTGRRYMGREIARVMSHRGAAWLERDDRALEERPDILLRALDLAPDAVVADLGAGTGYFTFRLADEVPEGRVYAVDIQPEMLAIVEARAETEDVGNVEAVLGTESDPNLPAETVDVSLLVDSYHEFAYPREMLAAVYRATRPGGRLVLVEYRAEDPNVPIRRLHKMTESQARREAEAAGFRFVENLDVLPQQHLLVFERAE
ncbi:MAG TPA: class I SAM-dependent methyltransferase [Rubricoccaceae bacterium]